jgi:hypothetical protein
MVKKQLRPCEYKAFGSKRRENIYSLSKGVYRRETEHNTDEMIFVTFTSNLPSHAKTKAAAIAHSFSIFSIFICAIKKR